MEYYFNKNLANIPASASLAVGEKARAMKAKGIDVISLAMGEPDFDTPYPIRFAAVDSIIQGHTHYSQARGILPLREAIAKETERRERNRLYQSADSAGAGGQIRGV